MKSASRELEHLSIENPTHPLEVAYDCIWCVLSPDAYPLPPRHPWIEAVDWSLRGELSRGLMRPAISNRVTFIPTMKSIPTPFVAVERTDRPSLESFVNNVCGQKWKSVLVVVEHAGVHKQWDKLLSESTSALFQRAYLWRCAARE